MFAKAFKTFFTLSVFAVLGYIIFTDYGGVRSALSGKYFPCKNIIVYSLGTFDPKFNITKEEFISAAVDAEAVWEEELGLDLFSYSKKEDFKNPLTLNLIYDYRQEATKRISSLDRTIDESRESYDNLKVEHAVLQKDYLESKSLYESRVSAFQSRQEKYHRDVEYWNRRGGATSGEYEKLKQEESTLEREFQAIKTLEAGLNAKADELNELISRINDLARKLNLNVREINKIGEARGEEFTEGEFKISGLDREINVYEFSTREKLVRLLAHEFGHALGIGHVEDAGAIMYYLNQNESGELSKGDLEAVKSHCKIE